MRYCLAIISGFLLLFSISCNQETSNQDPGPVKPVPPYSWNTFSMGVDLSYVNEIGDYGGQWSDSAGISDPFTILHRYGANTVRVRLWYNPTWVGTITGGTLYSDLADVAKTIGKAKAAGMAVSLDLHYSDTWADPDHQETPLAWQGLDQAILSDSVYAYTLRVLQYLSVMDLVPEMIQVGNETNAGMLFPVGQVKNDNWKPFGEMLKSGIKAVRDFSAVSAIKPKIILHVAQLQNAGWWMAGVVQKAGVTDFDILGISHYSKWSTLNSMDQVTAVIRNLRTEYGKPVMIVETAYPWTGADADSYGNIIGPADSVKGFPLTVAGQQQYLEALTQAVIDGGGIGVHYWEPAWITSAMRDKWGTGSAWDNCTLFDFQGKVLLSAAFMRKSYRF
jgi:arabinogalactan endo-1,4-beta-galactosidase